MKYEAKIKNAEDIKPKKGAVFRAIVRAIMVFLSLKNDVIDANELSSSLGGDNLIFVFLSRSLRWKGWGGYPRFTPASFTPAGGEPRVDTQRISGDQRAIPPEYFEINPQYQIW